MNKKCYSQISKTLMMLIAFALLSTLLLFKPMSACAESSLHAIFVEKNQKTVNVGQCGSIELTLEKVATYENKGWMKISATNINSSNQSVLDNYGNIFNTGTTKITVSVQLEKNGKQKTVRQAFTLNVTKFSMPVTSFKIDGHEYVNDTIWYDQAGYQSAVYVSSTSSTQKHSLSFKTAKNWKLTKVQRRAFDPETSTVKNTFASGSKKFHTIANGEYRFYFTNTKTNQQASVRIG